MGADSSVTKGAPPLPSSAPPPPPPLSSPPHSPPLKLEGDRQRKEVTPHARNGSLEQTGNNSILTDNAKSSFLKSTLSHTTSATEGNSTNNKTQQNNKTSSSLFTEEKSSLLGELKSRLNGDTDFPEVETKPRQMGVVTNPDQLVNKMVYNQYRGMLNSYRNHK